MPMTQPKPELDVCIEVAGRITASAISSGQIKADVEAIKSYLTEIYTCLVQLRNRHVVK